MKFLARDLERRRRIDLQIISCSPPVLVLERQTISKIIGERVGRYVMLFRDLWHDGFQHTEVILGLLNALLGEVFDTVLEDYSLREVAGLLFFSRIGNLRDFFGFQNSRAR